MKSIKMLTNFGIGIDFKPIVGFTAGLVLRRVANGSHISVGTGTMVASCVGSAAIGALICFLIAGRKRKEKAA
ncbi:MAG: hypothetical protein IKP47_02010 [Ruminococcus sp.]|nr:hypothetical protein [Ruminococcus sp.]